MIPVSYNSTGSPNEFKTKNKIDLTLYDRIGILGNTEDVTDYQRLGVTQSSDYTNLQVLSNDKIDFENDQVTYLDVSELTGEYYIQFGIGSYRNGIGKIQEIWLEKKDIYTSIEISNEFIEKGQNIIANVNQICNLDEINLQKSKYILSTESDAFGVDAQDWNSAQKFNNKNQNLEISVQETGTYYLHVLTVDNSNNMIETISKSITIIQSYLYNANDHCYMTTGGWNFYINNVLQTSTVENNSYTSSYGEYEIQTECLNISVIPAVYNSTGRINEFRTKNKIDLTNCNKIGILGITEDMKDCQIIGATNSDTFSDVRNLENNVTFVNNQITYLDVSELIGEYYIQFGIGSYLNGKAKIYKIWTE